MPKRLNPDYISEADVELSGTAKRSRPHASSELDGFDRAILRILQANNRTPQRDIGERVNLSAAAVQRRITRMERDGPILANVVQIDPDAIGQGMTFVVEVTLVSDHHDAVQRMKRLYRDAPEVQQCYCIAGEAGFILIIVCASLREYEEKTFHLLGGNPHVKVYRTLIALDRVKATLDVPL